MVIIIQLQVSLFLLKLKWMIGYEFHDEVFFLLNFIAFSRRFLNKRVN